MPSLSGSFSVWNGAVRYIAAHKIISAIVIAAILGGGYYAYSKATAATSQNRYLLGTAATGTIVASVSESGQVSTTDSIDVKPQVSGTITWVGVTPGQHVNEGQALISIDDTTAQQTLADAERQLAADELTFQQSQAQAPINYQNDQTTLATDKENLQDDYNSTFNDLTSTYLDLPNVMSVANDTLYGYDIDTHRSQWNMDALENLFTSDQNTGNMKAFQTSAVSDYTTANTSYNSSLSVYQLTTRTSSTDQIDKLLTTSIATATDVAQALQSELNFLGTVSDLAQTFNVHLPTAFSTLQTNTRTSLSTANQDLSTLLADKKTLDNAKQAIVNAQNTLNLDQVGNPNGNNPISLQVSANSLEKEKEDIANQETNLAKYTVTAPFSGTVSIVDAKRGDQASSGAVASIVTDSQIAQLSVNEVDAAQIKLGDKVTLTFDAIDGLTLTGTVTEIDPVGTVSQGVVSYNIKVSFDTQDARVKPGMTVNAEIQTGIARDTLVVPSSAVKTSGGQSYVLAFTPPIDDATISAAGSQGVLPATAPQQIPVTTGLTDGTNVQILSGLTSGQQIVTSTRASAATPSAAAAATSRTTTGGLGGGAARGGATTGIRIGG